MRSPQASPHGTLRAGASWWLPWKHIPLVGLQTALLLTAQAERADNARNNTPLLRPYSSHCRSDHFRHEVLREAMVFRRLLELPKYKLR